jgi:hypothetical protein
MSSANSQRSFFLFYPVTRTTYQASSSSSQLESLTRSSSFLLHILVMHFPRCVSFLSAFTCILSCLSPPSGRFWTCLVPSVRRKLGSVWACSKNLPSVVLWADSFLSPQPDPPCFHSLGWLMVQPPVLFLLTDFSLGSG